MDCGICFIVNSCVVVVSGALGLFDGTMVTVSSFLGHGSRRIIVDVFAGEFYWYACYGIDIYFFFSSIMAAAPA